MEATLPTPSVWLLTWALAAALVVGTAAVVLVRHWLLRVNLNLLDLQVQRLLSSNNRARAVKLSQALPDSPALMLLHFALTRPLPDAPDAGGTGGYRDAARSTPFEARALDHLRAEADRLATPFARSAGRLSAAIVPLALVGVGLAFFGPDPAYRGHCLLGSGALGLCLAALVALRAQLRNTLYDAAQRWARFVEPA